MLEIISNNGHLFMGSVTRGYSKRGFGYYLETFKDEMVLGNNLYEILEI